MYKGCAPFSRCGQLQLGLVHLTENCNIIYLDQPMVNEDQTTKLTQPGLLLSPLSRLLHPPFSLSFMYAHEASPIASSRWFQSTLCSWRSPIASTSHWLRIIVALQGLQSLNLHGGRYALFTVVAWFPPKVAHPSNEIANPCKPSTNTLEKTIPSL